MIDEEQEEEEGPVRGQEEAAAYPVDTPAVEEGALSPPAHSARPSRSVRAVDTDPDLILETPMALRVQARNKGVKKGHIPKGLSQPLRNYTKTPHSQRLMLRELEQQVGGRDQLAKILSYLPLDPQEAILVKLMGDPKLTTKSLAAIAARTGFSSGRVWDFFQRGKAAEAFVKSMTLVYDKAPDVAGSVMTEALPRTERCLAPRCDHGKIPGEVDPASKTGRRKRSTDCHVCEGRGYVIGRPEVERQRLALELTGLVKKGGGVVVNTNVQQNTVIASPQSIFAKFLEASDKVLFGKTETQEEVVEAEIVAPQEEVS